MKVLLIDNYDSFTFNLYQYIGELLEDFFPGSTIDVVRNDAISIHELKSRLYDRIILSPGPGNPADASYFGVCREIILDVARTIPTLGVCLGLQGIAHYYGGSVVRAAIPMHGKISFITHDGTGIFRNLPQKLAAMRYHSLIVNSTCIPDCFRVTAKVTSLDNSGEIMGLQHRIYPLSGVQFHPESFATDFGKQLLQNFLEQKI